MIMRVLPLPRVLVRAPPLLQSPFPFIRKLDLLAGLERLALLALVPLSVERASLLRLGVVEPAAGVSRGVDTRRRAA